MVSAHTFMLRCVPHPSAFQKTVRHTTSVIPACEIATSLDTFGNIVQTGYVASQHDSFMFESTGVVEVGEHVTEEPPNRVFCYPSDLTQPDAAIREIAAAVGNPAGSAGKWVRDMSSLLQTRFAYESGQTSVTTTAAEALAMGRGVCQDFAHIVIAAGREAGIPMRYVTGFMIGEGATHAWVEYHDGDAWHAFDPTNDKAVDDSYIKIAHGRDFNDCSMNRGHFCGSTQQTIKVTLLVEKDN